MVILDGDLERQGLMLKLLFPLKTPLFALRVGPRSMKVTVVDVQGDVTTPSVFEYGNTQSKHLRLLRKSSLDAVAKMLRQSGYVDILEV